MRVDEYTVAAAAHSSVASIEASMAFRLPKGTAKPGDFLEVSAPKVIPVPLPINQGGDSMPKVSKQSATQGGDHGPVLEQSDQVDGYTVNVFLMGPGGSMDAARTMMQAGAAVIRAGGAGVDIPSGSVGKLPSPLGGEGLGVRGKAAPSPPRGEGLSGLTVRAHPQSGRG